MSKSFAANFHKNFFSDIKTQTQIPLLALSHEDGTPSGYKGTCDETSLLFKNY